MSIIEYYNIQYAADSTRYTAKEPQRYFQDFKMYLVYWQFCYKVQKLFSKDLYLMKKYNYS